MFEKEQLARVVDDSLGEKKTGHQFKVMPRGRMVTDRLICSRSSFGPYPTLISKGSSATTKSSRSSLSSWPCRTIDTEKPVVWALENSGRFEHPVTGISEPRNDVAIFVELLIESGGENRSVRVGLLHAGYAFGGGQQTKAYANHSPRLLQTVDRGDRGISRWPASDRLQ